MFLIRLYREPHFAGYASKTVLQSEGEVVPSAFADVALSLAELFKR